MVAEKTPVSVIVLNYNGKRYLDFALDSIFKSSYPNFEVIFIDNGSRDGSVEHVKRTFGHMHNFKIVENRENYGYVANNLGIKYADERSKYLVFLNNDILVDDAWLGELVKTMDQNPNVGAVQCKVLLLSDRNRIDSCGHFLDSLGYTYQRGEDERDVKQYEEIVDIFYPYGAAFIIRRSILGSITVEGELFDSSYFSYHEDADLGWRVRLAGLRVLYAPSSIVYHVKGGTGIRYDIKAQAGSLSIVFHLTKNRITTLLKNYDIANLSKFLPILLCLEISRAVLVLPFYPEHSRATFRAIFYVFRNLKKILRKRQIVQSHIRRKHDSHIMRFMVKLDLMYNLNKFRKYSRRLVKDEN